ncbi:class I SAM-dependent methyltransferase [Hymenobacter metallilatus]|uniref:Class I SAM-dependent methyltransferase n=1 Tax=Hymenobacter metallilatus TaxID=2493666 RepID=A0A428IZB2_9BACT|nr:class I SAM-dependent methyltransferase [Hymenobacter metallilatus]RSK24506.1 class I SAM-dependent methyltransferase [Hymenobacter metallilatus]
MTALSLPAPAPLARKLYSSRTNLYDLMIRLLGYPQGLTRFFEEADFLQPGMNVLDAGCGSGAATLALHAALNRRNLLPARFNAFDLTPMMLSRFWKALDKHPVAGIQLVVADVLITRTLPTTWRNYDLIVSSAMLEYVPKPDLPLALRGLWVRLHWQGRLVVFISRQNPVMVPFIQKWWKANLYSKSELRTAFQEAGFAHVDFTAFPGPSGYLNAWGHIVVARP